MKSPPAVGFWRRHGQKVAALIFWALLLGGYQWWAWQNHLSPLAAAQRLITFLSTSGYGPLIYLAIYAVRPLVLFSATLLTVAAGLLFGPWLGILYSTLGGNLSAMVAYSIGRFFGGGWVGDPGGVGPVQRYADRMRANSFVTVMTMRLLFVPFDLVNYLAGLLRIDWQAFLLATIIGSIPGTIAFVLAGASLEGELGQGLPRFNPAVFAISAAVFVLSLGLSRLVRRRELGATPPAKG